MKRSTIVLMSLMAAYMASCTDHNLDPHIQEVAAWREGAFLNDMGHSIAVDKDGNVYVTGSYEGQISLGGTTLSPFGGNDVFIAKYNKSGELQWARGAGTPRNDEGRDIAIDESGNVYVTGVFSGFIGFGPHTLSANGIMADIFVVKYNTNGEAQWAKKAGGAGIDVGQSIAIDGAGNVYVTGLFHETATFGAISLTASRESDVFIAKYNSSGDEQWAQKAGGLFNDTGWGIAVDKTGNVYVTGAFETSFRIGGQALSSSGGMDIFIAKLDPSGNPQWAQKAGGVLNDYGSGIAVDENGFVNVTGSFRGIATFGGTTLSSNGNTDIFVARYNSTGALQWVKGVGGINYDYGMDIAVGKGDNIYVAGEFRESLTLGGKTFTTNTASDILVASFSSDGAVRWANQDGGPNNDAVTGIAVSTGGDTYITGYFYVSTTLANTTFASAGGNDIFVARYKE